MVEKSSQTSDGVKLTLFRQIPRQSARWLPARSVDTQNHPSFWFHFSRSQHHVDHVNNLCQSPCRRSSLLLLLRCSPLRTIVHTEPQHQDQLCRFIIDCVRERLLEDVSAARSRLQVGLTTARPAGYDSWVCFRVMCK